MEYHSLTAAEQHIMIDKGTEAPFSGQYEDFWQEGTFACKRCGTKLYESVHKFEAHCGWPSFDKEIAGTVSRSTDADGRRTEITCTTCGAHLGHLFTGEGLTPENSRHCVNSICLTFIPKVAA